jgi:hypothetical protein
MHELSSHESSNGDDNLIAVSEPIGIVSDLVNDVLFREVCGMVVEEMHEHCVLNLVVALRRRLLTSAHGLIIPRSSTRSAAALAETTLSL